VGEQSLSADYLVMGAGATAMAFTDALLSASEDATVVLVDRRDRPGGHWNDAYPFVRLHQPSSFYGVSSAPLGSGRIEVEGFNAGLYELASGQEVLHHFDVVMRERFLPSGRVRFLPLSEVGEGGVVTSLLSGERTTVMARRFVDATHSRMQIPATSPPAYDVAPAVACVPPNELPRRAAEHDRFVVVGAGKTGMDTCTWLLQNGAEPDQITWIVSRDSWVLDRSRLQPGEERFAAACAGIADQVEAVALAESVDDVFARLEACGEIRRIDPTVTPDAYHCATLSDAELEQLRRIEHVIRLGRVTAIDEGTIHLDHGTVRTEPGALFVDCTAAGIPTHPSVPIFEGDRITLQWVRTCQPTFSAAFIGFVEATFDDDEVKDHICQPVVPPAVPLDWLRMLRVELANRQTWGEHPEVGAWMASTRLDPVTSLISTRMGVDVEATEHLGRYLQHVAPAAERLEQLLDT
jgi:hypothetical protein